MLSPHSFLSPHRNLGWLGDQTRLGVSVITGPVGEQSGQHGMTAWRFLINLDYTGDLLGLFLFLLLILDLSVLVEDLLGLPVADQENHGGEDEDDGAPGGSVAETKNVGAVSA